MNPTNIKSESPFFSERKRWSRRNFLHVSSMTFLGVALPGVPVDPFKWNPAKLSVQLYTVRDQIKTDIPGTLKRVRDIGYEWVETAFWPDGISLQQAAKYLQDAGLRVSSSH